MSQIVKSLATGIASGVVTYPVAVYALARTSAFALPSGFPVAIWVPIVVFGLGVTLVAFLVHGIALAVTRQTGLPALSAFVAAFFACLALAGLLSTGVPTLAAALIGAGLATLVTGLRSNNSFKPKPLRSGKNMA